MPGSMLRVQCADPVAAYRVLRKEWPATRVVLYGDRLRVWVEKDGDAQRRIREKLEAAWGEIGFEPDPPSLEDAFVAMVTAMDAAETRAVEKESGS